MKFEEPDKNEAFIKVLLKQYDDLRKEIVECIHLEHWAIVGLYTSLGLVAAYLAIGEIKEEFSILDLTGDLKSVLFLLFILIFVQIIVNEFGSLFLKEQARNRRACSFQRAIEYIINKKIGGIGIYWENYITSKLIAGKMKWWEYFGYEIPINPQYYKNRLLGVGLPIFLPNLLITLVMCYKGWAPYGRPTLLFFIISVLIISVVLPFRTVRFRYYFCGFILLSAMGTAIYCISEKDNWILLISFIISFAITLFWALMIVIKAFSPLVDEGIPCRERVVAWLEEENRNLL